MVDQMVDGRRFRVLTIVHNFTYEKLCLYVVQNIKGDVVDNVPEKFVARSGKSE